MPKYYRPHYGDHQKGTPTFGKPSNHAAMLPLALVLCRCGCAAAPGDPGAAYQTRGDLGSFPKLGVPFWVPQNEHYRILGSI